MYILFLKKVTFVLFLVLVLSSSTYSQYRGPEGVDIGFRFQFHRDVQVYCWEYGRIANNFSEGKFGYIYSLFNMSYVRKDEINRYSANLPLNLFLFLLSGATTKLLYNDPDMNVLQYLSFHNSQFEWYLSNKFKILCGINTDFLFFSDSGDDRGILFNPKFGVDFKIGIFHCNLNCTNSHFINFERNDKNYKFGLGVHFYSGVNR